ncbi:hypothetical protein M9H77_28291 [Catharanthus roseus]|uniref:Uncharacterized protein n=1 Tax=Catharanthus roseus TaxID=4058 RepID=A0ACC0AJ78_CATRO|nr:hypothetical protein M9H77_28291 [Catharanthus roseus]
MEKKREHERSVSPYVFTKQFMQYYKKTFPFNVLTKLMVSSEAGKSERIKTRQRSFYALNLKEHVMQHGAPRTKSESPKRGHWNQVPSSPSQYQPNTIRALDYQQLHSHITSQNKLQTPGAPTRSALGPTSVSSPS